MKNKKLSKKEKIRRCVYPVSVIVSYGLGVLICSEFLLPQRLSGNFFFGLNGDFSFYSFIYGWLYQLLPFLVITLSGYDFLGFWYSLLALSCRSYLSGYAGKCFVSGILSQKGMYGVVVFTFYTLFESLILIILLSGSIEQVKFRNYYISVQKSPLKIKENTLYVKHNLQRCGIMIFLYILRSLICFLI